MIIFTIEDVSLYDLDTNINRLYGNNGEGVYNVHVQIIDEKPVFWLDNPKAEQRINQIDSILENEVGPFIIQRLSK